MKFDKNKYINGAAGKATSEKNAFSSEPSTPKINRTHSEYGSKALQTAYDMVSQASDSSKRDTLR